MPDIKHGTFYWNELMTDDVTGAVAFYRNVIGWEITEVPMDHMAYWVAGVAGQPVAGIMGMPDTVPEGTPPHWMAYITVDDVDAEVAKAKLAGATIIREPFDVPKVGRIVILKDGGNAIIGWITPSLDA